MHIYRRQARNLAWYDDEGAQSNHNPFRKFRARPRRSSSYQLEGGTGILSHRNTESALRLSAERTRAKNMTRGLGGPEHSDTFHSQEPEAEAVSAVLAQPPSRGLEGEEKVEPSMKSTDPINLNAEVAMGLDVGEGKPRRRFFGKFGGGKDEEEGGVLSPVGSVGEGKEKKFTAMGQLKATVFNSWINILILAAPVGIALNFTPVNKLAVFIVNFIAIIPLAAMLSYATEEVAMRTGETIGGLLNASFGNAVELIVAIIALVKNKVVIVQTSLIGSMLSNLLLVMGMCFFFGGVNRLEQHFNVVVAQTAASLLALAVASLIIPTAFQQWSSAGSSGVAQLSRGTSVIMLVVYGCYLFFQLKSHTEIYNRPSPKVEKRWTRVTGGDASRGLAQIGKMTATMGGQNAQDMKLQDPNDEEEEPQLSIWVAFLTLGGATALVAVCSEYMVDSINTITDEYHVSETFVGLILLPIVGNAAEHATAVTVACKDKMDLAIGVAVGSSLQIALLVLPLIVVIGWCMGNDDMTLNFDGFEVILLFVSVLLVNYLIADGKSHWLEGVQLMMMYLVIAVAAWFYGS